MKYWLLPSTALFCLLAVLLSPCPAQAQERQAGARLSFLSADDRAHFLKVRRQVLEGQPDLKTEQESLQKEWKLVKAKGTSATPEDKETLRTHFQTHNEKMDGAMLQADPSISSVLDQIKAHRKAMFQERTAGATDNSSS